MKVIRQRGVWRTLVVLLAAMLLLSGCGWSLGHATGLEFGPSDVETVEVFLYEYDDDPADVSRSLVTDRVEVSEFVAMFTDVPVREVDDDTADRMWDAPAAGVRFHLRDGSTEEITRVFIGPKDVVLIWPDGRSARTEWGADIGRYGTPADPDANESVDPDVRPQAVIR